MFTRYETSHPAPSWWVSGVYELDIDGSDVDTLYFDFKEDLP